MSSNNTRGQRATLTVEDTEYGLLNLALFTVSYQTDVQSGRLTSTPRIELLDPALQIKQANWEAAVNQLEQAWGPVDLSGGLNALGERRQQLVNELGESPAMQIQRDLWRNPQNFEAVRTNVQIKTEVRTAQ